MPKALITGATGYVGSQLAKYLVRNGWDIGLLVRQNSIVDNALSREAKDNIYRMTNGFDSIDIALKKFQPDVVYHLASSVVSTANTDNIEELLKSNLIFPTLLLEAMHQHGVRKFVNTGTSWQHFDNRDYNPVNLYAASKDAYERLISFYVEANNFNVITLKLFDTYGPDDPRKKLFYLLRNAAHTRETLSMTPGHQLVDLVYAEDVADAYLKAGLKLISQSSAVHDKYAVSSMAPIALREVVRIYCEITNQEISIDWGAIPYRAREVIVPWTKFDLLPGWKNKYSLTAGIRLMENSILERNNFSI